VSIEKILRVNECEERELYRRAVSRVILDIQRDTNLTLLEISDEICVSVGTISNAANKKGDLKHVFLQRLGVRFGVEYLNPVAVLMGARYAVLEPRAVDPLPRLTKAILSIVKARDPSSAGGEAETHCELVDMLPDLHEAATALQGLISRAEKHAA
jgi:hypothetical protein